MLIMTTAYFKYRYPREAFFFFFFLHWQAYLCELCLLWGANRDGFSVTSFCLKLFPLFWFLSHDPDIELKSVQKQPAYNY